MRKNRKSIKKTNRKRRRSKKTFNRRKQRAGGCQPVSDNLDYAAHPDFGIPREIIEFCRLWVEYGENVCLDQGENQKDTLYLSLGSVHDSANHIHLYKFNDVGPLSATAEAKDKRSKTKNLLVFTPFNNYNNVNHLRNLLS